MVEGYEAFLRDHASSIDAIARFSFGELTTDDVRNEAWLLACEWAKETGLAIDLAADCSAREILKRVRRKFDRATRGAKRTRSLDRPFGDEDSSSLHDVLVGDDGAHPLSLLEDAETQSAAPAPFEFPDHYHSELAAWNWLLRRLGSRNRALADFLMISASWCYQRRRRIRTRFDIAQEPLPHAAGFAEDEGALRPWRKFKLPNRPLEDAPRQAVLDFWGMPAQPVAGQLWLL